MAGIARTLVVTIDGKTHTIRTNPGDYDAWVEECNGGDDPGEGFLWTYRDLLYLAWHACTRLELTTLDFPTFRLKGMDDLEVPAGQTRRR